MADQLMANVYQFPPFPAVTLPATLTWAENPFHDDNWQFQFHAMSWLLALTRAWSTTGNDAYLGRALDLAHSWVNLNPWVDPPSPFSWDDHSTALRAIVFTCVAEILPRVPAWLQHALTLHGRTLANPSFYVKHGNHALNQSIGLLEIGCFQRRHDWIALATHRIDTLLVQSVDPHGAANEGSVGYELYNWERYGIARKELRRCGESVPGDFSRIGRMPSFLAYATRPDASYETIGDTRPGPALAIPGTIAQFAATQGAAGPKPRQTVAQYAAGYVFGRTGWGATRPYGDEDFFSLRFSGPRILHGHADGSAITLYGLGRELLVDPGYESYNRGPFRHYFKSQAAHNALLVDGYEGSLDDVWTLTRRRLTPTAYEAVVQLQSSSGLVDRRRVIFSRRLGFLVVEDRAVARATTTTFRQLWHLPLSTHLIVSGQAAHTSFNRGNVLIRELATGGTLSVVIGQMDPIQGWLPTTWGNHAPAPVLEDDRTATKANYVTLLVPYANSPDEVRITNASVHGRHFAFDITVDGQSQHVQANGNGVAITDL